MSKQDEKTEQPGRTQGPDDHKVKVMAEAVQHYDARLAQSKHTLRRAELHKQDNEAKAEAVRLKEVTEFRQSYIDGWFYTRLGSPSRTSQNERLYELGRQDAEKFAVLEQARQREVKMAEQRTSQSFGYTP